MPAANEPPVLRHYSDLDAAADASTLIAFLEASEEVPALAAVKSALLDRLGLDRARHALDVGCGLGSDVLAMARRLPPGGTATGVDVSHTMIAHARLRAGESSAGESRADVRFEACDAASLPFDDDSFDACRAERVLLHVTDPPLVLAEMARVTRPGGRVAVFDFDTGTMAVDHPDTDTTRIILDSFPDSMAQGWIGRQLPRLFRRAGLTQVEVEPTMILSSFEVCRLTLSDHVSRLCADGALDTNRAGRWWSRLAELADGGDFLACATFFLVSGVVLAGRRGKPLFCRVDS